MKDSKGNKIWDCELLWVVVVILLLIIYNY